MGPKIPCDGMHSDAMNTQIKAFLDNTQEATHLVAKSRCMWELITHKHRNTTYISDEQLHAMELSIYHDTKVQVESLDGEPISHMCRCSGSLTWHAGA
jgi:hypothetical protein